MKRLFLAFLLCPVPAWAQSPLTREEAEKLALTQASSFQQSALQEKVSAEDVRIARAATVPHVAVPLAASYNTPELGPAPAGLRPASFLAANGITEYQAGLALTGTIDISGNLHAAMAKSVELLAAAHAGTRIAERSLINATDEAYYALALARARRGAAELNLDTAQQAEKVTGQMLQAGEVAAIDRTRAHQIRLGREDELEQAAASEAVAAHALQVLIGYPFDPTLTVVDLASCEPVAGDLETFRVEGVEQRPELSQLDAQGRAAAQELRQAQTELRPQLTYSLNLGFDSSTLAFPGLYDHSGLAGSVYLNIPLSDGGASRARTEQARLRQQIVDSQRAQTVRQLEQGFATARDQARSAAARVPLSRQSLQDAARDLTVSVARYRGGEATVIEVTDAQTRLAAQRSAYFQAIYDYQLALSHLRQSVGP